ncbi:MAG: hypothetical protein M1829_005679 [Trizodia sp. TS-e1964]|nr:MAG: hypothetical protein M1829_005679 [Trizodia sp. TS-e1964]
MSARTSFIDYRVKPLLDDCQIAIEPLERPCELRRYQTYYPQFTYDSHFKDSLYTVEALKQIIYRETLIPIHHQKICKIGFHNKPGYRLCFQALPNAVVSNLDIYVFIEDSITGHFSIRYDIDQPLSGLLATLALAVNIDYPNPHLDTEIPYGGPFALNFAGNYLTAGENLLKSYGIRNGSKLTLRWAEDGAVMDQHPAQASINEQLALNDAKSDYYSIRNQRSLISSRLGRASSSVRSFFTAPTSHGLKAGSRLTPFLEKILEKGLIQDDRFDWSGRGQFAEFSATEDVPLEVGKVLGHSLTAVVQEVKCRRIKLARKSIYCRRMSLDDAMVEIFHLQKFDHPHIIQLIGAYIQDNTFSILLYPVADMNLEEFMADNKIEIKDKRYFLLPAFLCAAHALDYIHKRTTRHMDIKPSNFLVKRVGSNYRLYLADFDVATDFALEEQSQTVSARKRTPLYCSPEAAQRLPKGRASDIFSLGCVFSEMLTVSAGRSLEEFAAQREKDGSKAFHINLPATMLWLNSIPDYAGLSFGGPEFDHFTIELTRSMLSYNPADRPTAKGVLMSLEKLRQPFGRWYGSYVKCCTSEREKLQAD